ncbi:MAG: YraN family protein [Actinomycetota bacterium]
MGNGQVQIIGEDAAAGMLAGKGMKVVARNWRSRFGELDLVALDGATLVFVEVKCRRPDCLYEPALAVDRRKRDRLRRLAEAYLVLEQPSYLECRFDVVSVVACTPPRIRHFVDAF